MAKPYYADYVNRLMRWYCRANAEGRDVIMTNYVDYFNWTAVESAMSGLTEKEKHVIIGVYCKRGAFEDNVYQTAKEHHVKENDVWSLVGRVTKKVAEERGLI